MHLALDPILSNIPGYTQLARSSKSHRSNQHLRSLCPSCRSKSFLGRQFD